MSGTRGKTGRRAGRRGAPGGSRRASVPVVWGAGTAGEPGTLPSAPRASRSTCRSATSVLHPGLVRCGHAGEGVLEEAPAEGFHRHLPGRPAGRGDRQPARGRKAADRLHGRHAVVGGDLETQYAGPEDRGDAGRCEGPVQHRPGQEEVAVFRVPEEAIKWMAARRSPPRRAAAPTASRRRSSRISASSPRPI